MDCCLMSDVERYLRRSDEIISQMANQMLCRTSLSDVTIDFCECMIPCCQGVIALCRNILQYTENEDLQEICNNLIQNTENQIDQLEEIRNSTNGFINSLSDVNIYVSQYLSICRNMICRMRNSSARCVNLSFICQMIPCLEGIICMCENCLQNCIDPRLRTLCENMIEQANEEVGNLRKIVSRICSR